MQQAVSTLQTTFCKAETLWKMNRNRIIIEEKSLQKQLLSAQSPSLEADRSIKGQREMLGKQIYPAVTLSTPFVT